MVNEIGYLGTIGGCRVIIDQLDSMVDLPCVRVLTDLATDCSVLPGVEVVVISRGDEEHEAKAISALTGKGFVELHSYPLTEADAEKLLNELGIDASNKKVVTIAKNLLNLELIARIKEKNTSFDFSAIENEIDLWDHYVKALLASESKGEELLAAVTELAREAINSEDGSVTVNIPMGRAVIRLRSWGIIVREYGRVYRFRHEKLQDYFYAWDATERCLMPPDVLSEINKHRSMNILDWMRRIYARDSAELYARFLKGAFDVE